MVASQPSRWSYVLYDFTVWFFCTAISIFFREIGERNAHSIPEKGPVFFVAAPHHNQFVDPIVLLRHCRRRVYLLTAASSMTRRYVGAFARAVRSIPVARAQDYAKLGSGTIQLKDRFHHPTHLVGQGTQFQAQIHPGDAIALPNLAGSAKVEKVLSDTELVIAREYKDLRALELLTQVQGAPYKIIPHLDQSGMYDQVHHRLNQGDCIGIFPEGGSHDRTEMLPLKAGVAVMCLGAMAENPNLNVPIVPCGLNYFHPHKFRSRAIVQFGDPITIAPELVEKYKRGGAEKREACSLLLEQVSDGLQSVTINTPDYETLQLIQAGRRLYRYNTDRRPSMGQVVELTRRFVKGYMIFKDHPAVQEIRERLAEYNQDLIYYGLRDHQVSRMTLSRSDALLMLLWRLLHLSVTATLALPGVILNAPVFIAAKLISKKKAKEALAKSTVKIEGRDVVATWKILVCLGLFPALYITYAICAVYWRVTRPEWFAHSSLAILRFVGTHHPGYAALLTIIALPILSFAWLWVGERGVDIYKSLRPLFLTLILGADSARQLAKQREALAEDMTEVINELAPKIYPDFDKHRSAVAKSARQAGLRHRRHAGGDHSDSESELSDKSDDTQSTSRRSRFKFPSLTPTTLSNLSWVSPLEFLGTYSNPGATTPGEFTRHVGDFFGVSDWQWDTVDSKEFDDDVFLFKNAETSQVTGVESTLPRPRSALSVAGSAGSGDEATTAEPLRSQSPSLRRKLNYMGSPGTTGGLSALTQLHPKDEGGSLPAKPSSPHQDDSPAPA
ncbi:Glycerol-3-phosphate/dihydroxyacetone phosphate acyltransferase [Dimargaris xerosporica]|nr:Glycerol-3-phosphate/dihydroxyacetone phosphate acyltransferase [Dimargaris xerosporica]